MRRTVVLGLLEISLVAGAAGIRAQAFKAQPAVPLEKTQWTLTWVGGTKVEGGTVRPAYIELDPASKRLSGSGGCNRLMGGYQLEGDHLRLTGTARTMMACLNGTDTEDKLVKALGAVREWKISGQELELLDADNNVLAKFSAGAAQ